MRSADHGRAGQSKLRGREWQSLRTHADNTKGEAYHFKTEALPDEAMPIRGKFFVHGFLDRLCLHVRVQTC